MHHFWCCSLPWRRHLRASPCGPHGSRPRQRATRRKSLVFTHFQAHLSATYPSLIRHLSASSIHKNAHFKARKTHHFKARKWKFLHRKISQNVTISSPKWCFHAYDLTVFVKKGRRAEGEPELPYSEFPPAPPGCTSLRSPPLHPTPTPKWTISSQGKRTISSQGNGRFAAGRRRCSTLVYTKDPYRNARI